MSNFDMPNLFTYSIKKQQEAKLKNRLVHIVDALDEYDLISDEGKEYIPDPQSYYYKTLMQAVKNGIDCDEAFLTLPHDIQTLSTVVPDYCTYNVEPYKESSLLIPKFAGKLAVMITGDYGDFKQSKCSEGLYLANLTREEQVELYPELLASIRKNAPRGITNIGHMTAGHTAARDIQRPTGANRTNYSSTDGLQVQRHLELDGVRPADWSPVSRAHGDASGFLGGVWDGADLRCGVRFAGELEDPQDC